MTRQWDEQLGQAREAWKQYCKQLEETGLLALDKTILQSDLGLAEGLRHLTRVSRVALESSLENRDSVHPYISRTLGPSLKLGGDNPAGLYHKAPINGSDTYRISGNRGSAAFVSFMAQRSYDCFAEGLDVFGGTLFMTDLEVGEDGRFELNLSPSQQAGNWIETDKYSSFVIIRQFFSATGDVIPMDLRIENLTRGDQPKQILLLADVTQKLAASAAFFQQQVSVMQLEMIENGQRMNSFASDDGDPTSNMGGVPGGNGMTCRWKLAQDEALVVILQPPTPCPYWDVQVGTGWYESWDFRHFFSGFTGPDAHYNADGSVTVVLSERDPGTVNWLETAGHPEGHMLVRWLLTEGQLPVPQCRVVNTEEVQQLTDLAVVSKEERTAMRRAQREAIERRFRL